MIDKYMYMQKYSYNEYKYGSLTFNCITLAKFTCIIESYTLVIRYHETLLFKIFDTLVAIYMYYDEMTTIYGEK